MEKIIYLQIYITTLKPTALFYINTMKHTLYVNSNLFQQGYWKFFYLFPKCCNLSEDF